MFTLKYVKPEEAEGDIKNIYEMFPPELGAPAPLELMTASPGLLMAQMGVIGYYKSQDGIEAHVLAAIRYVAARVLELPACIEFNAKLLAAMGLPSEALDVVYDSPEAGPFDARENALVGFVKKVMQHENISIEMLDELRGMGWSDTSLYDAASQGAFLASAGIIMNAFGKA